MEKKAMTLTGLDTAMLNLCGTKKFFTVAVTCIHHTDTPPAVEWKVYHEDIGVHSGPTPEDALASFTAAWNMKKGMRDSDADAEMLKADMV